jgi:tRNA A37 threonylcarbamoyltransferase TsaD
MLVGGVGANKRLGEMLRIMCEERGAKFFLPPGKFMGDNGSMIAYTGLLMLKSGVTTPMQQSKVRPNYRTDDVAVTWA